MAHRIEYKASVVRDLKRLDRQSARRVLAKLERELSENPDKGLPLKGAFQGLFRLRVGDYRVIYAKTRGGVLVLRIGHRSDIYR